MDRDELHELRAIQNSVIELKLVMTEHGKDLKEHIRRTELLEDHVTILNGELIKLKTLFMIIGWGAGALGMVAMPVLQYWLAHR
jgi:hypothetical protein